MGMSELGLENNAPGMLGAVPSSFATQMALATGGLKAFGERGGAKGGEGDDSGMMGRLMLARMKTLEEGFAEVVKEFRGMGLRTAGNSSVELNENVGKGKGRMGQRKGKRRGLPRTKSAVDIGKVGLGLEDDCGEGKGKENFRGEQGGSKDTSETEIIGTYVRQGSSL
jgi:hypothetical protein